MSAASIICPPGQGERYERRNRSVTIKVDLPEISIHELEFDPSFEVPPHTHEHVDTMFVLEGTVEILGSAEPRRLSAGTVFAAPPGTPHGFRTPGPGRARVLIIHAPDGGFSDVIRNT